MAFILCSAVIRIKLSINTFITPQMHILGESKAAVNIECKSTFKKLDRFYSGYVKKLKEEGRADTTHTQGKS